MILSAEASNFSHLYLLFFDLVGITHTELRKFSSLKISKTSSPLCPYFFHMITKNVWTSLSKRDEQRFWNFLLLIFNNLRNKTGANRPISNIFFRHGLNKGEVTASDLITAHEKDCTLPFSQRSLMIWFAFSDKASRSPRHQRANFLTLSIVPVHAPSRGDIFLLKKACHATVLSL